MTVKELIEKLQEFNPELEVEIEHDSGYGNADIDKVYQGIRRSLLTDEKRNIIFLSSGDAW